MSPRFRHLPPSPPPRLAAGLVAVLFAGCSLLSAPATPRTRFFVIDPIAQPQTAPAGPKFALGLGPLSVPPYLERPEMVRRLSGNQLAFDEFNRWGEPLKSNVLRVLGTNLERLVEVGRLVFHPWYSNTPLDYAVSVTILRFEPQPDDQVVLDARWTIADPRGTPLRSADAVYRAPAGTPEETAAAMSGLCADLSRDIATALRALGKP